MRAALVSFLTHHMNHAWQDGVEHLARCFWTSTPASTTVNSKCKQGRPEQHGADLQPRQAGPRARCRGAFVRVGCQNCEASSSSIHVLWMAPVGSRDGRVAGRGISPTHVGLDGGCACGARSDVGISEATRCESGGAAHFGEACRACPRTSRRKNARTLTHGRVP